MNLREKIKKILREEISTKLKRRLPDEDLEEGFIESFNIAYRITKNRKLLETHFLEELVYTTISVMMDSFHYRLISTLPEDENWYQEIHNELLNHYKDRIIMMYNENK